MSSTNPMDSIAPTNAAAIKKPELTDSYAPNTVIITMATVSFAPEEIPSTYGPAMGLLKNVCNKNPESASAPPKITAADIRGKRISQITLSWVDAPPCRATALNTSLKET